MYERKIPINLDCGIEITMNVIGGKWNPWLINRIREGRHRPMDLQRAIPITTKRVLTQQLNELENIGLFPIIDAMNEWGNNHRNLFEED